MTLPKQITVLLADDHAPVRRSLRALLDRDGQIWVVGEACNGKEAVEMASRLRPNIILMDISMPIMNGLDATRLVMEERPSTKVIILSAHLDEEYVERAKALGAVGYVAKQMFTESLTWVIHEVAMGRRLYNLVNHAAASYTENRALDQEGAVKSRCGPLSIRESALLKLVAEGLQKRKIASKLRLSIATVERRLAMLMAKVGVLCMADLADYGVASGCIESDVALIIT